MKEIREFLNVLDGLRRGGGSVHVAGDATTATIDDEEYDLTYMLYKARREAGLEDNHQNHGFEPGAVTVTTYDFQGNAIETEIPDEIAKLTCRVISGDEVVSITCKNGETVEIDSSPHRLMDFCDGEYTLSKPKKIRKWENFRPWRENALCAPSYDRLAEFG